MINYNKINKVQCTFSSAFVPIVSIAICCLLAFLYVPQAQAAVLSYTPTAPSMTFSHGALNRINDGNIATNGVNDYQVHPSNAIGKTIFMTFAAPVTIENVEFYNRTSCCKDRIGDAKMIFKDAGGAELYTYTFPGPFSNNTTPYINSNLIEIADPSGNIAGVKTVELTDFKVSSQNFREIIFNAPDGPGGVASGLTLWLDADDASTLFTDKACTAAVADGEDIGCWHDKSGQLNHVAVVTDGAREPTYNTGELNSKPTLQFAADSLVTPDSDQLTANTGYTKFAVVKYNGGGSNNIISSGAGSAHAFWGNGGTQVAMWHSGTFMNSANLGTANYQIGTGRYGAPADAVDSIVNVNGVEADRDTTTRNFAISGPTRIGSHGEGHNLNGHLAEAIVYDRALSDSEIDTVECYLADKWDITVSHCEPIVPTTGPGGVGNGLGLWLKADEGTSCASDTCAVNTWADQSSHGFVGTTGAGKPVFNDSGLNFNPTLSVTAGGLREQLTIPLSGLSESAFTRFVAMEYQTKPGSYGVFEWFSGFYTHFPYFTTRGFYNRRPANRVNPEVKVNEPFVHTFFDNGTQSAQRTLGRALNNFGGGSKGNINGNLRLLDAHPMPTSQFGEYVLYDRDLNDAEKHKVESYLATKYGMTLDQSTATSYTASDGTTEYWDSAAPNAAIFNNDIAIIGRDDLAELGQIKSKSVNADAVVTITADGEGSDNQNTAFVDIDDLEYIAIANNNGAASWTATGAPVGAQMLSRQWIVQETGELGTITIDIDVADAEFNIPALNFGTEYYIVLDTDVDGNLDDESPVAMVNPSGDIWRAANINVADGQRFSVVTVDAFTATVEQTASQADPATTNPILFDVTFDTAIDVPSFTAADIATAGSTASGITVNSITEITPNNGTTFRVSVNAASAGSVVLSLNAGVVDSSVGGSNLASTSVDNVVVFDDEAPQTFSVNVEITGAFSIDAPRITFATVDNVAVVRYEVDIDGDGFSVQTSPYTPTLTAAPSHTVTVRAYDAAGNFTESMVAYPPSVIINAPTTVLNTDITDTTFVIDGPNNITSITATGPIGTGFTCEGNALPFAGSLTPPVNCIGGTIDDSGTLMISASDGGFVGTNNQSYTIDTVPPNSLTIDTNLETDDIVGPTEINDVSITGAGAEATSSVVVSITDGTTTVGPIAATVNANGSWSIADQDFAGFVSGNITVTATETDLAGNDGAPVQTVLVLDILPPILVVQYPNNGDEVEQSTMVTILCNEASEIITITNTNLVVSPVMATCIAAGSQSVDIEFNSGHEGSAQNLDVTLTDPQGNTTPATTVGVFINDGDNIPRSVEENGPNGGDANDDGMPDAEQTNVAALVNKQTGRYNALTVSSATCNTFIQVDSQLESDQVVEHPPRDYPLGLWDFQLECAAAGQSADIVIYLDRLYNTDGWRYHKHDAFNEEYVDISGEVTYGTALVGSSTVTTIAYTVVDGQALDSDGSEDALISDPAGPAVATIVALGDSDDTSGNTGGSGGGRGTDNERESVPTTENITLPTKSIAQCQQQMQPPVGSRQFTKRDTLQLTVNGDNITYDDVKQSDWFMTSVAHGTDTSIFNGFRNADGSFDGTFRPGTVMTRAHFLKMIAVAATLELTDEPSPEQWYVPFQDAVVAVGSVLAKSYTSTTIHQPISRRDVAQLIMDVMKFETTDNSFSYFADVSVNTRQTTNFNTLRDRCVMLGDDDTEDSTGRRAVRADASLLRSEGAAVISRLLLSK